MNTYSNEYRRNVVAVVKSGLKVRNVARRLGISPYTVYGWVNNPKFSDVQPASEEMLAQLPTGQINLVQIKNPEEKSLVIKKCIHIIVRNGSGITIEFPDGLAMEQLIQLMQSMKDNN